MTDAPRSHRGGVTVVIPARDRPELLAATVDSALAQDLPPAEIIVVDDGSRSPLEGALAGRPDVRVLRHSQSRGVAAARNAGILAARTPWVALLDDDDLWAPSKLRMQLEHAERAQAGWAFCAALLVDPGGNVLEQHAAPRTEGLADALREANSIPAGASNVLARRDLLVDAGLFDEDLRHFADWDLWLRLAARAPAVSLPDPLVAYLRHGRSMQVTEIHTARDELAVLSRKHTRTGNASLGSVWLDIWLAEGLAGGGHPVRAAGLLTWSAMTRRSLAPPRRAASQARRALARRRASATPAPPWARPTTFRPPVD